MKRKGFTLVELLVVIAIIALLMGLLMPALARVKQVAYRMVCGTNLAGIGKAILIYSNDNDEEYPYAGGSRGNWTDTARIWNWTDTTEYGAFGETGDATISSNYYLLLKNTDSTPKQFVCKGDVGCRPFKLSEGSPAPPVGFTLEDCWDFGGGDASSSDIFLPSEYCSYAYHMPYRNTTNSAYPISVVSDPGCPLSADRNPYLDRNADAYIDDGGLENPIMGLTSIGVEEYIDPDKKGNSASHQREGQNVLFNDTHVNFEKYPNVGIEDDNIWKYWPGIPPLEDVDIQVGSETVIRDYAPNQNGDNSGPLDYKDAYLVNHDNHR